MIIGIDASRAMKPKRTGTEVYNAEIIKSLVKIDQNNTYRLYASNPPQGDLKDLGPNVQWRVMTFPRGWTLIRLSWEMLTNPPDILFIPAHTLPLYPGKRSIVMIHDIGYDHFPELYKWTDKLYHRFDVRFAKQFASHILTPTEFTRQDLHKKYKIPLNKITAIHHGFDSSAYKTAPSAERSPEDRLYFFYIGRLEYKKNIQRIIEAFISFKQETNLPHKLILAGYPAHGYNEILKSYEKARIFKEDIIFTGYMPQKKATQYLRHAEALVFPSLFEGFGLPVLEAFASGTPVITSNTTCLPEIAGDAALLVDPTDVTAIKKAMVSLAKNHTLRQQLIKKGQDQYKEFSWETAARKTLAVIEKVGERA